MGKVNLSNVYVFKNKPNPNNNPVTNSLYSSLDILKSKLIEYYGREGEKLHKSAYHKAFENPNRRQSLHSVRRSLRKIIKIELLERPEFQHENIDGIVSEDFYRNYIIELASEGVENQQQNKKRLFLEYPITIGIIENERYINPIREFDSIDLLFRYDQQTCFLEVPDFKCSKRISEQFTDLKIIISEKPLKIINSINSRLTEATSKYQNI